jgi:hypothetical protein
MQEPEVKQAPPQKPQIAPKKKLNKADYMFNSLTNQLLVKKPGEIDGISFSIKDLDKCTVLLLDHTA